MDAKQAIAAIPWLRKGWRAVPGPWRVPMLVVGVVVWLWRRRPGHDPADGEG